jgi:hypothetical protein
VLTLRDALDGISTSLTAEQKGHAAWLLYKSDEYKLTVFLSELADCDIGMTCRMCDQFIRQLLLLEDAATGQFRCSNERCSVCVPSRKPHCG